MNKKRTISLIMSCMIMGSIGVRVLADENTDKSVGEKANVINVSVGLSQGIEYKILEEESIEKNSDIKKWVEENASNKGTYMLDTNEKYNYVMISLGRLGGGGHEIMIQDIKINDSVLNIAYDHFQSEKGKMMRNISFPHIVLEIPKAEKFSEVKSQKIDEMQVNIGGGKLFNEMTGEYNIVGTVKNITKENNSFVIEIERNGAPMKVRIDEDILAAGEKESLVKGAGIRVLAKEKYNDEKKSELVAHKVMLNNSVMQKEFKDYEIINRIDIKDEEIKGIIDKNKEESGFQTIKKDGYTYVMIFGGTRNSGGYNLEIQSVDLNEKNLDVIYKINEPKPGGAVTMAITYPMKVIRIADTHEINEVKAIQSATVSKEENKLDKSMSLEEIEKNMENADKEQKLNIIQKLLKWIGGLLK